MKNNNLIGVAILYLSKGGEVSFFAKEKNVGVGSKLLNIIDEIAKDNNLESVWGWVLENNSIAKRVFEKMEFKNEGICKRVYMGKILKGVIYKKYLDYVL